MRRLSVSFCSWADSVRAAYRGWERGCRAGRCRGGSAGRARAWAPGATQRRGHGALVALLAMRTSAGGGAHEAQAGAAGAHEWLQGEAVRGAGAGAQAAACSGGGGACEGRLLLGGAGGRAGLGRGVHRGDAGR
jgi:hypothetical protein